MSGRLKAKARKRRAPVMTPGEFLEALAAAPRGEAIPYYTGPGIAAEAADSAAPLPRRRALKALIDIVNEAARNRAGAPVQRREPGGALAYFFVVGAP